MKDKFMGLIGIVLVVIVVGAVIVIPFFTFATTWKPDWSTILGLGLIASLVALGFMWQTIQEQKAYIKENVDSEAARKKFFKGV